MLSLLALGVGCGPSGTCTDGDQQCSGMQVQTCADGAWSVPVDCEAGQSCMTMDNGMEHCMDGMGDDDDSAI